MASEKIFHTNFTDVIIAITEFSGLITGLPVVCYKCTKKAAFPTGKYN